MAFTFRPSSTISSALNDTDNEFNVASTTNIAVGDLLAFANETMHVRGIPVSGRVSVRRGYDGTHSLAHKAGETFFIGTADEFGATRDAALGLFGPSAEVPNICIPGSRAFDSRGYEYVLVDLTSTRIPGTTVAISKDGLFTATILTTAHSGPVGLLVEGGTSDQWVWAQRRGYNSHAKLVLTSSLMTSTGVLFATTIVSTPSVGLLGRTTSEAGSGTSAGPGFIPLIFGMWPASAATTATTAATSETGLSCEVWLEYPYVNRLLTS